MEFTTTAQRCGSRIWMRTMLMAASLALLVASAPHPAAAADHDPTAAGTQQARNCELMGGEAHVEVDRTVEGVRSVTVICNGGMADGILCDNTPSGTNCVATSTTGEGEWPVFEQVPSGPIATVLELLERGSVAQITAVMNGLQGGNDGDQVTAPEADDQDPVAPPSLGSGDDQDRQQGSTPSKGQKGKHGKKGGKHRKH